MLVSYGPPAVGEWISRPMLAHALRLFSRFGLDEHEWVAVDDGDDVAALADKRGHALQRVAGQRAAGAAAGDPDQHGLGAVVVGSLRRSAQSLQTPHLSRSSRAGANSRASTVL